MPDKNEEPFSNPIAPAGLDYSGDDKESFRHPLTNNDFRKLLMTPRAPTAPTPSASAATPAPSSRSLDVELGSKSERDPEKAESRKKKKSFYAQLKKEEDDKMVELARKYRDRAKERRDCNNSEFPSEDPIVITSGYRAVAPDVKSGMDAAERRRQMIQESKFLGGDMEHTHLVKGLDYALLQKVRSELTFKEQEEDELEEILKSKPGAKETTQEEEEQTLNFKTKMGRTVYRVLFKSQLPERNELFLPGRLAYVIDIDDEFAESDIPTTLVRSKADCPSFESHTTLTTNDIVINKLTQILSYLRQGPNRKNKKKDKKGTKEPVLSKPVDESIYENVGDYVPNRSKQSDKDRKSDRSRSKHSYFEKPKADDSYESDRKGRHGDRHRKHDHMDRDQERLSQGWAPADIKLERDQEIGGTSRTLSQEEKDRGMASVFKRDEVKSRSSKILKRLNEPDSYAECYPGAPETADAIDDSDDEVDYTKMDMGNKKGPIGRWDFDTQEEYSDYMNQKEALPKAAFQYGVKMADGRKTRRTGGKKDEKAELDREWQKISQIISKRKPTGRDGEPEFKLPKY